MMNKVNHPQHYTGGDVECIDAIMSGISYYDGVSAFCAGNVIKYVWRAKTKNGLEDLHKARWYLDRLIAEESKNEAD